MKVNSHVEEQLICGSFISRCAGVLKIDAIPLSQQRSTEHCLLMLRRCTGHRVVRHLSAWVQFGHQRTGRLSFVLFSSQEYVDVGEVVLRRDILVWLRIGLQITCHVASHYTLPPCGRTSRSKTSVSDQHSGKACCYSLGRSRSRRQPPILLSLV